MVRVTYTEESWYQQNKERVCRQIRDDRKENPEKYRLRDRARYERDKDKRIALAKKWADGHPEKRKGICRKWIENNQGKRAAHVKAGNAIKGGKLVRQPCEVCGESKVHAHHEYYSKPLDVVWLCSKHHALRHRLPF